MKDAVDIFMEIRDVADEVVKAYENENEEQIEKALTKFMMLMIKLEAMK